MKKLVLSMLALLMMCVRGEAQTITVPDVEALPGETVAFVLNLSDGKANTYTSLQFDAVFPEGFTTTGDYVISSNWKNATAVVGDVIDGVATIPVSSAEAITDSDVDGLFSVDFKVADNMALGDYEVTLKNITFGYGWTDKDIAPEVTFKVHVVSVHSVVLDENSTVVPETAEGVNVRVLRTIKAGEWSTICLPFAMTEAQVKTTFGDDVQLGNFCDTESEYDDADNVVGISIAFEKATEIEANHPYIIKVSQPVTEFAVDNVDVDPVEEDALVEVDNGLTGRRRVVYGGMYGTYHAQTELEEFSLFLNDNKFWYSTGLTKMKAFRAYFVMADVLTDVENAAARISFSFNDRDEETTGIVGRREQTADGACYDLQGRKVVLQKGKKGVYVKNGRKEVIK